MNLDSKTPPAPLSMEDMIAYLEDQLDPKERAHVEAILAENPIYAIAVENLRASMKKDPETLYRARELDQVAEQKLAEMARKVSQGQSTSPLSPQVVKPLWQRYPSLLIAAGFTLLLVSSIFLLPGIFKQNQLSETQLADRYLAHFEDPLRSAGAEDSAIELYEKDKNYAAAIPLLRRALSEVPDGPKADKLRMYLGVSLLQTHQAEAATDPLQQVARVGEAPYRPGANFYLALAYLKQMKREQAIPILQKLVRQTRTLEEKRYADNARQLLAELGA